MSFVTKLDYAKAVLERQSSLSVRALGRELELDGDALNDILEELVAVQQVAGLNGKTLHWAGPNVVHKAAGQPQTEPAAANYTPKHLAEKILASRSAMEGEIKQVTVLFCDVVGSMDLAEALGPEIWHETMNACFEVLTSAVHEFEGSVNQYTGDGIMALFGAPIAAEDHARRACMAALAMQENLAALRTNIENEFGEQFATRIGINSGEVVVGRIGDDLRMDYTAQGHVVGIAARLEAIAPANGTLLSDLVAKKLLVFDLKPKGHKTIKGLSEQIEVFELGTSHPEITRFDVLKQWGLTRFIGRQGEMATLNAALEQAQSGNGQVVGVMAEAGIGKTRLCHEFLETCKARGMTVLEGHAQSHGKNIPLLPMLQIFKAYYDIAVEDDDCEARRKITDRLLSLDAKFEGLLPILFEFFDIADPTAPPLRIAPEAMQRQLVNILRKVVQGADPNVSHIIAYIEDLHWLDEASEVFLDEWVDALAGTDSFLLVNFRPEYSAAWMHKTCYQQISLAALSPDEVQEMLFTMLGSEPSVKGLAEIIFERTGGNPFFCEEVVKSLQESGNLQGQPGHYVLPDATDELNIPASVHAILAARIDRLNDDEKMVLQTAAIIGRGFEKSLLAEVTDLTEAELDACLTTLKVKGFIS